MGDVSHNITSYFTLVDVYLSHMQTSKRKILVGNWKMNPGSSKAVTELVKKLNTTVFPKGLEVIICPPALYLGEVKEKLKKTLKLGAQDNSQYLEGSHTGEVGGVMYKNLGLSYVIIGHSERRAEGETDPVVASKVTASVKQGLRVILCVGESLRDEHGDYLTRIREQVISALSKVPKKEHSKIVLAYEPLWAIGKSAADAVSPIQLHEMVIFLRKTLTEVMDHERAFLTPILYGGSVTPENAETLLQSGEVNGILLGRESLKPLHFKYIADLI